MSASPSILAKLTTVGTSGKVREGVVEVETFSDPGSVLVPHFSGQLRPLVELVALGNIHCDPVQRLELKGFFDVKVDRNTLDLHTE